MHSRHTAPVTTLEIRAPREADEEALLAAFNRAFARADPGFRPRDERAWRWRYHGNPHGTRVRAAFDEDGAPLAQYAALGQRARVAGEELVLWQGVDSFSDPGRRGLGRKGAFVQAGQCFADECGSGLIWGIPMPDAWRIGRRFLAYGFLEALWTLVLDEGRTGSPAPAHHGLDLSIEAAVPDGVDALFERTAKDHAACTVKDRAWLDWRYAQHPERDYVFVCARRGRGLRGLAVLATGGERAPAFDARRGGVVCEWLVPVGEPGVFRALLDGLRDEALRLDLFPLVTCLPPWSQAFVELQDHGFRVRPSRLFLAARSFERRRPLGFWSRHLWLVPGDTDLV